MSVGRKRSPTQTTAQAQGCISAASLPRIPVAALLQLAQWCQQRRVEQPGGGSCLTTPVPVSPPVASGSDTAAAPDATVGTARPQAATGTVPSAQPAAGPTPSARRPQGGAAW